MAGVNKNFVVKNGLEVDTNLIYADADNNRVGINTNNMKYTLHVNGGIGATTLYATGISTFNSIHLAGDVTAGNAGVGSTGQYLVRIGTGVTWQNLPSTRSSQTFTATAGQTVFLFSYTVGLIDVFINGVKLSPSEYTANDTASVILNTACFGDETVELITYSSVNPGYGYTGIYGISLFEEGSPVGTTGQVVALNFVGAAVTSTATGVAATIYLTENWEKNSQGIFSLNSVGLGTTSPRFALEVGAVGASGTSLWVNGDARVTGILTVGSSSIVLDGSNNTINVGSGVTINGNTGIVSASNFYASGIQVGVITATTIIYQGATLSPSQWVSTAAGIHTLSSVGIGTTNPTSALTVKGNTSLETLNVSGIATFAGAVSCASTVSFGTTAYFGVSDEIVLNDKFKVYTDASNTYLKNFDTNTGGDLYIQSDVTLIQKYDGTETIAQFTEGAGVQLNYQGQHRLSTVATGVIVGDNSAGVVHIPNELRIGTVAANQSNASIMIANSSGVGIGTTNPTSALTVKGNTSLETLNVSGIATVDGITLKSKNNSYSDNIIITQHPAATFTGNRNVAIGDYSFTTPGAAGENVAIGYYALNVVGNNNIVSTYNGNTAVGAFAGEYCTTTLRNTLIGWRAGRLLTGPASGSGENTIIGAFDGNSFGLDIRTSSNNVVLSDGAGNIRFYANSSGNVGFGTTNPTSTLTVGAVGSATTTLQVNGYIELGSSADKISINQNGSYTNTHIGVDAGKKNGGGSGNTALGNNALKVNQNSNNNTALGSGALASLGDSASNYSGNTGVGQGAGNVLATGSQNTFIGSGSGNAVTSGSNNTILGTFDGNQYGLDIRTSSNNVVLSDGNGQIRFYANSSGNVGLGTTNPTSTLTVGGATSTSTLYVTGVSTVLGTATFGNSATGGDSGTVNVVESNNGNKRTSIGPGSITFNNGEVADIQKIDSGTNFNGKNQIQLAAYAHIGGFGYKTFLVDSNGPTELYYGYLNKKFATSGIGVTVYGTLDATQINSSQLSVSGVSTCTGSVTVGVSTAAGVILTSPNGTKYQLFVENDGTLKTVAV